MPRTFSSAMAAACLAQQAEEVITSIVRITHPDIEGYFLTNDSRPVAAILGTCDVRANKLAQRNLHCIAPYLLDN